MKSEGANARLQERFKAFPDTLAHSIFYKGNISVQWLRSWSPPSLRSLLLFVALVVAFIAEG